MLHRKILSKRKIFGELVKKCSKNIDENEMVYNETICFFERL